MAGQLGGSVVGGVVYIQQHHDPALAGAERASKVIQFCNVGDVINVAVICGDCTSNVRILVQIILEIGQVTLIHHLAQIDKFALGAIVHQIICDGVTAKNICLCKVGGGGGIDHLGSLLVLGGDIGDGHVHHLLQMAPHRLEHTGGDIGAVGQIQGRLLVIGDGPGFVARSIVDFQGDVLAEIQLSRRGRPTASLGIGRALGRLFYDRRAAARQNCRSSGHRHEL